MWQVSGRGKVDVPFFVLFLFCATAMNFEVRIFAVCFFAAFMQEETVNLLTAFVGGGGGVEPAECGCLLMAVRVKRRLDDERTRWSSGVGGETSSNEWYFFDHRPPLLLCFCFVCCTSIHVQPGRDTLIDWSCFIRPFQDEKKIFSAMLARQTQTLEIKCLYFLLLSLEANGYTFRSRGYDKC